MAQYPLEPSPCKCTVNPWSGDGAPAVAWRIVWSSVAGDSQLAETGVQPRARPPTRRAGRAGPAAVPALSVVGLLMLGSRVPATAPTASGCLSVVEAGPPGDRIRRPTGRGRVVQGSLATQAADASARHHRHGRPSRAPSKTSTAGEGCRGARERGRRQGQRCGSRTPSPRDAASSGTVLDCHNEGGAEATDRGEPSTPSPGGRRLNARDTAVADVRISARAECGGSGCPHNASSDRSTRSRRRRATLQRGQEPRR